MIEYVILDGTQITFINGKTPTQRQRQSRRRLNDDYIYEEQKLLQELNRRNFLVDVSKVYALIKRNILNKKLSLNFFRGLGWFFSIQFNCPFYRECYRRIRPCVFWLQLHYREIKDFLIQHSFKIKYDNSEFKFSIL